MKELNMQEMDQVNGGANIKDFINKVGEVIDTAKDVYDVLTGNDGTDIETTYNEDGTVTVSGGW